MKKHQYPQHVVDAVQNAILNKTNIYHGPVARQLAEVALEALWDASRVDTLDQLAQLPGVEVILGQDYWLGYTPDAQFQLDNDDLPARILHWGGQD